MLTSSVIAIIVATVLGLLSGLGVGGGSLLILWLTLVLQMEHAAARTLNLLFFLPCALISTCFRWKQGTLPWKKIFPAMIAGCLFSGVLSWVSRDMDTVLLKKCFGVLLLFTGTKELLYRLRKAK